MSRGGRGGGRGGRGGMRGNPLPFDVDMDLVDSAEGSVSDFSDENKAKQLFPPIEMIIARPLTDEDRKLVALKREMDARRRKSVWWTGTKEQLAAYDAAHGKDKKTRNFFDAFDSHETYSKKKRAKAQDSFVPPEKQKYPKMDPQHVPAEVMPAAQTGGEGKKKGTKKSVTDRLANVDEGKDDEGEEDDDDAEGNAKTGGDDDDAASEPQDSEFSEDEADDADNDYNAENYFSGGEGDDGSVGGEEADDGNTYGKDENHAFVTDLMTRERRLLDRSDKYRIDELEVGDSAPALPLEDEHED